MFKVVTTSEEDSKEDFQIRSAMVGSGAGKSSLTGRQDSLGNKNVSMVLKSFTFLTKN